MADKTDTSIAAKQDGDASPKADRKAEGANPRTKQQVSPARSSAGGTADKQAAKAKRAATAKTRRTQAVNAEAAKVKSAAAAEARGTREAADREAAKVRQAAVAEARTIKETARKDADEVKKAAADEAGRVRKDAKAQAGEIRQAAQAEAQARPETETGAPDAAQEMPGRGVPSLDELTRKVWERNMELAMSMVPAYLRIFESAAKTFSAYRPVDGTGGRFASASGGGDDQGTQSVPDLGDPEARRAAR
jgi:hypothetical protein